MHSVWLYLLLSSLLQLTQAPPTGSSTEWTRFRGPNGSGVADAQNPPVAFGRSEKVLWKVAVPPGHSSPIIWKDHVFLTAVDQGALETIALRRTDGAVLWRRVAPTGSMESVHAFNNPAAPTPTTDGERVYAYFGSYGLLAYDFNGREVWKRPLPALPNSYGTASSPIVVDGKLIVQRDGSTAESELLALDAKTGAIAWRTPRPTLRSSWSTPTIWKGNGRDEIITLGTNRVIAYSLAGAEQWWVAGLTEQPITAPVHGTRLLFASATFTGSPSDPVDVPSWDSLLRNYDADTDGRVAQGELPPEAGIHLRPEVPRDTPGNFMPLTEVLRFADADKNGIMTKAEWDALLAWARANEDTVLAIRPGKAGDNAAVEIAWRASRGLSEIPSPLCYRGRVYFVKSGGMVTSYAEDTGEVVLDRQRLGALGQYVASPIAADGRIYAASEPGTVVVFRAADTLDVLARNDLGESITATPAIADGKLYVRTADHLWAFGDEAKQSSSSTPE